MEIILCLLGVHVIFIILAYIRLRKKGLSVISALLISWFFSFFAFLLSFLIKSQEEQQSSSGTSAADQPIALKIYRTPSVLLFEEVERLIKGILDRAGIVQDANADAELYISLVGEAIGVKYGPEGSQAGQMHYTGAVVRGNINYKRKRIMSHEWSCKGVVELKQAIYMHESYRSPSSAPYKEAFERSGFNLKLVKALRKVFGPKILVGILGSSVADQLINITDPQSIKAYILTATSGPEPTREKAAALLDKIRPSWRSEPNISQTSL